MLVQPLPALRAARFGLDSSVPPHALPHQRPSAAEDRLFPLAFRRGSRLFAAWKGKTMQNHAKPCKTMQNLVLSYVGITIAQLPTTQEIAWRSATLGLQFQGRADHKRPGDFQPMRQTA